MRGRVFIPLEVTVRGRQPVNRWDGPARSLTTRFLELTNTQRNAATYLVNTCINKLPLSINSSLKPQVESKYRLHSAIGKTRKHSQLPSLPVPDYLLISRCGGRRIR